MQLSMLDKPKTLGLVSELTATRPCRRPTDNIVTLTAQSDRHNRPSSKCNKHQSQTYSGFDHFCCCAQLSGSRCGEQPATDVYSGWCGRRLPRRAHTSSKYTRIVHPVGKLALQVTYRCSVESALLAQTVTRLSDCRLPAIDLGI